MRKQISKRIAALVCAAILMISLCPNTRAEEISEPIPASYVQASSITVYPGDTCYISITGYNFNAMAALGLMIAYDPSVLTVESANSWAMDFPAINTGTAGFIMFSGISMEGISGDWELLSIAFSVAADAPQQDYSVTILVTEAVSIVDDEETNINLTAQHGKITVAERPEWTPHLYFYAYPSSYSIQAGDTVSIDIHCYDTQGLAAGQFAFVYDSEQFEFVGLELLYGMKQGTVIQSVNNINEGLAVLAYSTDTTVSGGELMRLTLRAKDTASGKTTIKLEPGSLVDENEKPLAFYSCQVDLQIAEKYEQPVLPKIWVEIPDFTDLSVEFTAQFWVEGSSSLAAGDFSLAYSPSILECLSVTSELTSDENNIGSNGIIVINDSYAKGRIKFSYINSAGTTDDLCLISIRFRIVAKAACTFTLTPDVDSIPINSSLKELKFDCQPVQGTIVCPHKVSTTPAVAPTCTETGLTEGQHCTVCGRTLLEQQVIDALGHTEETMGAKDPTCTDTGLTEGSKCSVCGDILTMQEILPALGHEYDEGTVTTKPTCSETGVMTFVCTRAGCDHSKTEEIPATGHTEEVVAGKDPTLTETGLTDGKICSVCGEVLVEQQKIPVLAKISGVCGDSLTWTLTNAGVLTISGTGDMPDFASSNAISSDFAPWSDYTDLITRIAVTDGVTRIGSNAFSDCSNLTKVEISETVAAIGVNAFSGCGALETVVYRGSEEQWNDIVIDEGNDPLEGSDLVIQPFMVGDVNGDETINVYDAIDLLSIIANGECEPSRFAVCDINEDGIINVYDAIDLLSMIANGT